MESEVTQRDLMEVPMGRTCVDVRAWRRAIIGLMATGSLKRKEELERTYFFLFL